MAVIFVDEKVGRKKFVYTVIRGLREQEEVKGMPQVPWSMK
jgi:hypothetical protein